jgi:hypothetical protein
LRRVILQTVARADVANVDVHEPIYFAKSFEYEPSAVM